jgi:hypothetical protein
MNLLTENGIPKLTVEQITELCEGAEYTARQYILSKVSSSRIATLDVAVDAEGTKPLIVNVDVTVVLSTLMKNFDVDTLAKEATQRAFDYIEEYLRDLKCKSKKY